MIRSIVTVCTGNICRSPIAQFALGVRLPGCIVSSAGLGALVGHQVDPSSRLAAEHMGLAVGEHVARQFDEDIGRSADLILVMDQGLLRRIRRSYPQFTGKCFLLRHDCETKDVPDPYKQGIASHYRAVELILEGADEWSARLEALS